MRTIMQSQKSVGIPGRPLDSNLDSIYQQYKQVIFDYCTLRKSASTTRAPFQYERIEKLALAGKDDACTVWKNIKNGKIEGYRLC